MCVLLFTVCEDECIACGDGQDCWTCRDGDPNVVNDVGYYLENMNCYGK